MAHSTPNDPMARPALYFGIALIAAAVFVLISNLFTTIGNNSTHISKDAEDARAIEMANTNLAPIGTVKTVDKSIVKKARTGREVYAKVCASCHATGVLEAPKFGSKEDWEPRIALGLKGLLDNAINGKGGMPARGGDPNVTDEELTSAILLMTGEAGFDLESQKDGNTDDSAQESSDSTSDTAETTATVTHAGIDGEKVYKSICFSCHDMAIAGAPKFADKASWEGRIGQGTDALYNAVINGKGAMPAKGGMTSLSDDEIKAAVDFMVKSADLELSAADTTAPTTQEVAQETPKQETQNTEQTEQTAETSEKTPVAATTATTETQQATPITATAAPKNIDGEKVYRMICFSCHDVGVAKSPQPGDKEAWAPRIAKGIDALYQSSLNGIGAMPAKGGMTSLSDDEVKAAVDYIVAKSQ